MLFLYACAGQSWKVNFGQSWKVNFGHSWKINFGQAWKLKFGHRLGRIWLRLWQTTSQEGEYKPSNWPSSTINRFTTKDSGHDTGYWSIGHYLNLTTLAIVMSQSIFPTKQNSDQHPALNSLNTFTDTSLLSLSTLRFKIHQHCKRTWKELQWWKQTSSTWLDHIKFWWQTLQAVSECSMLTYSCVTTISDTISTSRPNNLQ